MNSHTLLNCHSERSEESRHRTSFPAEILRVAQDDTSPVIPSNVEGSFRSALRYRPSGRLNASRDYKRRGFTLIELAIALMVIGLLIGGVLKGQELIENAKITATMRDVKAFDTATMVFRSTYNALPGDIRTPNRIPNCTTDLCLSGGDGNGKFNQLPSSPGLREMYNFFVHLSKAGMIQGPADGTIAQMTEDNQELFFPATALSHSINVWNNPVFWNGAYEGNATESNYFAVPAQNNDELISVKYMSRMDLKFDDGKPYSGDIQIEALGDCPAVGSANEYEADDTNNIGGCPLVFRPTF